MEPISRRSRRTRLSQIVTVGNKLAGAAAIVLSLVLTAQGCQTSFTPKPHCKAGWHAEHAPSHQGHVWDCVADYGPGRVPG